jgi:hypothetical protein
MLLYSTGLSDPRDLQPFSKKKEATVYTRKERIQLHSRLERMSRVLTQSLHTAEEILAIVAEIEDRRPRLNFAESIQEDDIGQDEPDLEGNPEPSSHALPTAPADLESPTFNTRGKHSSRLSAVDEAEPRQLNFDEDDEPPSSFQSLRTMPRTPGGGTSSAPPTGPPAFTRQERSSPLKDYARNNEGNVPVRQSAPAPSGFDQSSPQPPVESVYSESPISKGYQSFSKYTYEMGKTQARLASLAQQVGSLQGTASDKREPLEALRLEIIKAQPPQFLKGEWAKAVKDQVAATMSNSTQIRYSKLMQDDIFMQYKALLEQVHGMEDI